MTLPITPLERRLLPFVALQGLLTTLGGFAGVFVYAHGGMPATVRYAGLMLTVALLGVLLPYALGGLWRLRCERLVQLAFAVPAALLWFAEGRPDLLALAFGAFLGLSWGARHWLEVNLLPDTERDAYAAHATVLTVVTSLVALLSVTLLLPGSASSSTGAVGAMLSQKTVALSRAARLLAASRTQR